MKLYKKIYEPVSQCEDASVDFYSLCHLDRVGNFSTEAAEKSDV
jgi:hypothetical protein